MGLGHNYIVLDSTAGQNSLACIGLGLFGYVITFSETIFGGIFIFSYIIALGHFPLALWFSTFMRAIRRDRAFGSGRTSIISNLHNLYLHIIRLWCYI